MFDPDICLSQLLDAFRHDNREAAWTKLENLHDWLAVGGTMPTDPRQQDTPHQKAA